MYVEFFLCGVRCCVPRPMMASSVAFGSFCYSFRISHSIMDENEVMLSNIKEMVTVETKSLSSQQ
jgi:hypothetical protein